MRKMLLLVMIFPVSLLAQNIKVSWGPEYKKDGGSFATLRFGGYTDKVYYVIEQGTRNSKIFAYNFNHNPAGQQEIEYKYGKSDLALEDVMMTKSGTYFIMGGYDKNVGKGLLAYTTPTKSNLLNPNFTTILEYPYDGHRPWLRYDDDQTGSFISYDSSRVLYLYSQALEDKMKNQQISFLVMDDHMKLMYKFSKTLPYEDPKFDIIDNAVMGNGDVFLAAKHYQNDKDRKTPNYKFHILKITSDGTYKDIEVRLKDGAPLSGNIIDVENGNVMVAGSYTNISNYNSLRANGTYTVLINNSTGEVVSSNIYPFTGDLKVELFDDNENRAERGAVAFKAKRTLYDKSSKSVTICFEKDYSTLSTHYSSSSNSTSIYYHTDDIIVARFNQNGKQEFQTRIDKNFSFPNTSLFNSFSFTMYKGNYFFLFNDAKSKNEKKQADVHGTILTDIVKMDSTGTIIFRNTLFGNKDIDVLFSPSLSVHMRKNEWLIHSDLRKSYKYGILYLPE